MSAGPAFEFPFDTFRRDTDADETTRGPLQFDATPGAGDSLAAQFDVEARSKASQIVAEFEAMTGSQPALDGEATHQLAQKLNLLSLRLSDEAMAAVIGHLPFALVTRVARLVFQIECSDLGAVPETLLARVAEKGGAKPVTTEFAVLAKRLTNSDALHQSLLRSSREAMRDFPSPFAALGDGMRAFSVFDLETGLAKAVFTRRKLDPRESLHPILRPVDYNPRTRRRESKSHALQFGDLTDTPIGTPSVVQSLDMFKRAFRVFTMGLLKNAPLGRDQAIVAGGAVSACLLPWPEHIMHLYKIEQRMHGFFFNRVCAHFPREITELIEAYAGFVARWSIPVDTALFDHLCGPASPYSGSDIDVFFVCPKGSTEVSASLNHFPKMHQAIIRNRAAADVSSLLNLNAEEYRNHWIHDIETNNPDWDWFIETRDEIEKARAAKEGRKFKPYIQSNLAFEEADSRGWTNVRKRGLTSRLELLWTVRTTNSVTIAGCHPIRHTQLMLPVVRAPEQVIYPFDLDCVAVFFDGQQVYATPRSLRALNTRCNFVDTHSLRDRARCVRMLKYATRGFGTLAFEVCRHFPRCDVDANRGLREAIERGFPEKIAEGKKDEFYAHEDEEEEDFDEWELRFRFHPDAGSDAVEPPGELIGMDYTPAPLLYGPAAGPSDLLSQISAFEDPSQFSKLRDRLPLVLRLKYNTTNDPIAFRNEISIPRDNLIPMQFKFIKDSVVGRRVQFATGFHLCYICKKDVELTGEETKSDSSMPEELLASPEARQIVLCESCKDLNAHKRADSVDLVGKHALVTGGRVKIGREVALRLLRNGATVHVTTRFPLLLLHAFRQLEDAGNWWTRLHVYALDLKDLTSVGTLCDHLVATVERLDVFVQNAAQTVRRPAQYYEPIVKAEVELRESMSSNDLDRWIRYGGDNAIQTIGPRLSSQDENMAVSVMSRSHIGNLLDVPSSAMATLVQPADAAILQGPVVDPNWSLQHAPHGDPIDLRLTTSWTQALPHIPLSEMGEVLVINSLAPAMLLQKLQVLLSCMTRPRAHPTFVVNVSSREGNFGASNKNVDGYDDTAGMHPHTNMAKAALNRLTQTIAADWAKEGVYVTAVDPGWVSAMGPGECKRVVPPLTEEDGAARILDPIFTGMNGGALLSGVLLRNFQVSPW